MHESDAHIVARRVDYFRNCNDLYLVSSETERSSTRENTRKT